jgi:hypothetical protein
MVRQDPQNEALIMLHYLPSGSGVFAHNNGNFLTTTTKNYITHHASFDETHFSATSQLFCV